MKFEKYHGIGNDYLIYDCNKNEEELNPYQIRKLCNRNFGLGADGLLIGPVTDGGEFRVRVFNPDGSEAERGGNGIRIFAKYLKDAGYVTSEKFSILTKGGRVHVKFLNREGTRVQVEMGRLSFDGKDVGISGGREIINEPLEFGKEKFLCTCVSIGNPHCVIPMEDISKEKVCRIGKYSERAKYFQAGVNTQIVKVMDKNNLEIQIFERGVGYTLASGTSSCAAAGAAFKLGLTDSDVMVHMPGGKLWIQIDDAWNVMMTGSVQMVCSIELAEEYSEMLT